MPTALRLLVFLTAIISSSIAYAFCSLPVPIPGEMYENLNQLNAYIECRSFEVDKKLERLRRELRSAKTFGENETSGSNRNDQSDPDTNYSHIIQLWEEDDAQSSMIVDNRLDIQDLQKKVDAMSTRIKSLEEENQTLKFRLTFSGR